MDTAVETNIAAKDRPVKTSFWHLFGRSAFLWGSIATCAFYSSIPLLPTHREFLNRYFCSHWILYATTWLFAIGIAILLGKAMRLPREFATFQFHLARSPGLQTEQDWHQRLNILQQELSGIPPRIRDSALIQRYQDVVDYLDARQDSATLEDHLKYLHDVAGEKLHDSYALLRTITWAIPILGFLGTVIGITMAIANITPDQLERSMSEVTAGLAVAFDTTALSLSLSMILVFISFVTERGEQQILSRVESIAIRDIAPTFTSTKLSKNPIERAEQLAAKQILDRTEEMVTWQTELWKNSLDGLRTRWEQLAQQQQVSLASSLQDGMRLTLSNHHEELAQCRRELLNHLQSVGGQLAEFVTNIQEQTYESQSAIGDRLNNLWSQVQSELREIRNEQTHQIEKLTSSFAEHVLTWQSQLKDVTQVTMGQVKELQSQGQSLLRIVDEEMELSRVQQSLAKNLETLHATDTFEKALHSLTAAVHMMTIRNRAA